MNNFIFGLELDLDSIKDLNLPVKFMEFMVSPEAQKILAGINFEYPINAEVEPSDIVKDFGKFKEDSTPLYKSVQNTNEAIKIYDVAGWK